MPHRDAVSREMATREAVRRHGRGLPTLDSSRSAARRAVDQTDGARQRAHPKDALSILYVAEAFGGGLFEITRMMAEQLADHGHRTAIAYGVRPETPANVRGSVDPAV